MRKFKPNMLTSFLFLMLEVLAPISVSVGLMAWVLQGDATMLLGLIPTLILLSLLIVIFCCLLNLLTLPFTKRIVYLDGEKIMRGETCVCLSEVTNIELDSGMITRMGPSEPCCLNLYSENEWLLSIDHPSLMVMFLLICRCKNASFCYSRKKKVLFIWVISLAVSLGLTIYAIFAGT